MSAALFYLPFPVAVTSRGVGAPAAKAYFYLTGTLTKLAIYTTSALTTQASNPTTADGAGRFNEIYLDNTKTYRLVIKDQRGTTLCDVDPYIPGTAPDASALSPYSDAAAASAVAASSSASGAAGSAATAVSSASAAAAYLASLTTLPTSGMSVTAASRTALALLSTSAPAILTEEGRTGTFKHYTSAQYLTAFGLTLSTLIAADTAQGLFVSTATGAWVRQINGSISPMWFGMVEGYTGSAGANSTANNAAWTAMMSAIGALGKNASGNFKGLPDVLFPSGCFEFSATPDVTSGSLRIRGTGMGHVGSTVVTGSTRIKCYDCGGFRFQSTNTSGVSTGDAVSHQGSDQSSLEDLGFEGNFVATEAEYHGVHIRAQTHLRNVVVSNFAGDAFRIEANTSGIKGNANSSTFINCHGWGSRNGMYFTGNNTGSSIIFGGSFNNNNAWGIDSSGSVGSMFYGCEAASNGSGSWNDGTINPVSRVSDGTNRYFVISGQESGASTNAPSGTTGDNTWWAWDAAGVAVSGVPLWFSGILVRPGGCYRGAGSNMFSGCYAEGTGQAPFQGAASDLVMGGKLALKVWTGAGARFAVIKGGANNLTTTLGAYQALSGTVDARLGNLNGNVSSNVLWSNEPTVAPSGYALFYSTSLLDQFYSYNSSITAEVFRITGPNTTQQFNTGAAVPQVMFVRRLALPSSINGAITTARQVCRAATSSATYTAASGGTTVDTQARASQAQLAADLADMKAKLQAANLMT